MFICPLLKQKDDNRFGMMGIIMYGVNSHGRNQVFGFGFLENKKETESENYEFIFSKFSQYMELPPKVIMISRAVAAGLGNDSIFNALLKVYGKRCGPN